jgi:hypothetical protein
MRGVSERQQQLATALAKLDVARACLETAGRTAAAASSSVALCSWPATVALKPPHSPFSIFFKLLPNLHNNFKISKNESCSK